MTVQSTISILYIELL